jgi:hypothetical protein
MEKGEQQEGNTGHNPASDGRFVVPQFKVDWL